MLTQLRIHTATNSVKLSAFFFVALTVCCLVPAPSARAYVVINNYNSGEDAFSFSNVGAESNGSKATGTIVDGHRGNARLGSDFFANSSSRENGNSHRSSNKQLIRYHSTNRGGKSAGGGGGNAGRGGSRNPGFSQSVVSAHGRNHSSNQGGNSGTNLNVFHGRKPQGSGSGGPKSPGSAGGGAGGLGGGGGSGGGSGGSPSNVCGTPEPAALTVWALAGCCGYGLVRCRRRWFSAE